MSGQEPKPIMRLRASGTGPLCQYRVARRPETPEDALALMQAFYDVGMTVYAHDGEVAAKLDANPMLERAEQEEPRRFT